MSVRSRELPAEAMLQRYSSQWKQPGALPYTDCYYSWVAHSVSLDDFVLAFYTSWVFRLERWIIARVAGRPSTDQELAEFAASQRADFAVWTVEGRDSGQLLLKDLSGRTRSWLMVSRSNEDRAPGCGLWFGSAVLPAVNPRTGRSSLSVSYTLLLGFHKLYSRVLLSAAVRRLKRRR